jgi:phosphate transport system ATP-binding protein
MTFVEPLVPPLLAKRPSLSTRVEALSCRGVSVRYGGRLALGEVSFSAARGRITALVGPSGCGKTTLLQVFNRLTDLIPDCVVSGEANIGDVAIFDRCVDVRALRRRVGMIFQIPNPFPTSIRKNLQIPLHEHGLRGGRLAERIERALSDVGLLAEVKDRLDAPALSLSGGQQQRLCLARALALDPEIVLLDEPCSALDPLSSATVEDLIGRLRERYTVLIVTHNLAQARRIADDVAFFWNESGVGRLVEHGTSEAIFSAPEHPLTRAYVQGARG